MKSTDVIGRSAHALLSLPNAVLAPLAGSRPTIDGQRLTPRLQLLANGGKRALAGLSFPPTALERRFDAVGQWLTLAHGDDASWRDVSAGGRRARLFEPMERTGKPGSPRPRDRRRSPASGPSATSALRRLRGARAS